MYAIYNNTRNGKTFDFMDGPPFVTGKLHMGHLAIGSIKSSYLNFKNMMGYRCNNKLGYDCHGVPIESIATKELNIQSNEDLEKISMKYFNTFCKETIKKFEKDWEPIYNRMGRWANFNDVYKTMDTNFMESIWWSFAELYKKNMIYRSYKVVAYSYPLQSPLSNSEESQNYKNVSTKTVYVRFKILNDLISDNTYIIAWTTTPWTLVANLALCVNKNLDYDYVLTESGETYIIGKDKYKNCNVKVKQLIKTVKGSELVGLRYEPIYKYYQNDTYYQVVEDDYVQESDCNGTNIVHIAPTFGDDDYRICIQKNIVNNDLIRSLDPIDDNCKYNKIIKKYYGKLVFDVESDVLKDLKEMNVLVKTQSINHQYPYCYRTDTPLIYRVYESFYVDVQKIKEKMIEINKEIKWYPSHIGNIRFHQWLENARDWCISRSRYFGTPIPIWESSSKKTIIIDSIETLYKYSGVKVDDLHPEIVNDITFEYEGEIYKRVKDVFDCWYESGCVPFAQYHYPFENKELIDNKESLSEYIVEGLDQTRGWFYTLLVLSTALFNKKPTANIMVVGLVLGENGKKISKKDGNFIDPNILIDKYGADSIRLYLLQSPLTNSEPLVFKENDLNELKQILFRFKNASDFLKEHTHNQMLNNVKFDKYAYKNATNAMDCWIMVHLSNEANKIISQLNNYEIAKSVRNIIDLIEDITNWYIKFNRDRLKGKCGNNDWIVSTSVLNYIITSYVKLLAPFAPFITTQIYDELKHLNNVDKVDDLFNLSYDFEDFTQHTKYIKSFELLKRISRLIRFARMGTKTHRSSKTPIKSCTIYSDSDDDVLLISETIDLIQTELNIINISYQKLSGNIKYKVIPNYNILGKKYKSLISKIRQTLEKIVLDNKNNDNIEINIDNKKYIITNNEYTLEPIFSDNNYFDKDILIDIDFTYDKIIQDQYNIKKFITLIQQTRKNMGLHVWNKISIEIEKDDFDIVDKNIDYIKKRLECDININSSMNGNIIFEYENEPDKQIIFMVYVYQS